MGTKRGIGTTAVVALATIFAVSGCTSTSLVAIPSSTPTTVATPTATPTPTPLPTITPLPPTKPTLDQLVVSPDGLGPLVMDQPVTAEPEGVGIVRFDPKLCEALGDANPAGWQSTYPTNKKSFSIATSPSTLTGRVNVILVTSKRLTTFVAIHNGSTLKDLIAAYGSFDRVIHAYSTDLYVLKGTHGQLAFEVARQVTYGAGAVPYWSKDQVGRVQFMSIWTLGAKPVAFSGTDGGPGSCA